MLGAVEIAVDFFRRHVQLVGKVFQITANVLSGLVALQVVMVEVPIEMGLAGLLQFAEELQLDFLKQVETDEEVVMRVES